MSAHEYIRANLGHSSTMCKHCGGTPMENAALGQSNECPKAPTDPRDEALRIAREAFEIIAGRRQCIDNLMGNIDVAHAALAAIDALKE